MRVILILAVAASLCALPVAAKKNPKPKPKPTASATTKPVKLPNWGDQSGKYQPRPTDPASTGYSPTAPFPAPVRWQLPPGMTPAQYEQIQSGGGYYRGRYYKKGSLGNVTNTTTDPNSPGYREPSSVNP